MKRLLTLIALLISIILIAGCVGGEAKVSVDGSWQTTSLALMQNPIMITIKTTATNVGDIDAKNVEADVVMKYYGREVDRITLRYGTVKIGMPISKETIMNVQIPSDLWSKFDKNQLEMEIQNVKIGE